MLQSVSVIGNGIWATALVKIFSDSRISVRWLRGNRLLSGLIKESGTTSQNISNLTLNKRFVTPFSGFAEALTGSQAVVFAIPADSMQDAFSQIESSWLEEKLLISSVKGFIPGTGILPSHYVDEYSGQYNPVIAMSSSSDAIDIADKRLSYLTIAGDRKEDVNLLGDSLKVEYVKVIKNSDPTGVEYVAILKKIIAVAAGIASGLGYGKNFQSVLISNAMREVQTFLRVIHPLERDLFGSAYFGDLLATVYLTESKNKTMGKLIGQGATPAETIGCMKEVASGYYASQELHSLTRDLNIALPILNSVHRILHQQAQPRPEFNLIERQLI